MRASRRPPCSGNVTFDESRLTSSGKSGKSGKNGEGGKSGEGGVEKRGADGELSPEESRRSGVHHMAEFDPMLEMKTDVPYPY